MRCSECNHVPVRTQNRRQFWAGRELENTLGAGGENPRPSIPASATTNHTCQACCIDLLLKRTRRDLSSLANVSLMPTHKDSNTKLTTMTDTTITRMPPK